MESTRITLRVLFTFLAVIAISCSAARQIADIERPQVDIRSVAVTGLTFESADLVFTMGVDNPNDTSIRLNRFDYTLDISGRQFLKGDRKEQVTLSANEETRVDIPITLKFEEIYSMFRTLAGQDSTHYRTEIGVHFDLPVLGDVRIPVTREGYIPLIQEPRINMDRVELEELRATGADLRLMVLMDNPNAFALTMRRMNYDFSVSDRSWAGGTIQEEVKIAPNQRRTFGIPVSLNFLNVGRSALQILADENALNYRFQGNILFQSPHPLINEINFPFDVSGNAKVDK